MPSPNVKTTPGGGRRGKDISDKPYVPYNHDPKNLGSRTGLPMPKNIPRDSGGFEDPARFFDSPEAQRGAKTPRAASRLSSVHRSGGPAASGSQTPLRQPVTPRRKGKGRMSDLGDDIEDIGAELVGDEGESPGLEHFSTPQNTGAYFSQLRDPPPSVTLPKRTKVTASSPRTDYNAIPSPRRSSSHRKLSQATSSRGMTPPDDDDEEEEAFASGQVADLLSEDDGDEGAETARGSRKRRNQSIRSDRVIDPDADTEEEDGPSAQGRGDVEDFDFVDDVPADGGGYEDMDDDAGGGPEDGFDPVLGDDYDDVGFSPGPAQLDVDEEQEEEGESPEPIPVKRGSGKPRKAAPRSSESGDSAPPPVKRGSKRPTKDGAVPAKRAPAKKADSVPKSTGDRMRAAAFSRTRPAGSMERHIDPHNLPTIGELHVGDGSRRSSRVKVEPLAFWRNERVVYKRGDKERVMADIVKYDMEPVKPLGIAGKRARSTSIKPKAQLEKRIPVYQDYPRDSDEESVEDQTNPMGIIMDYAKGEETHRRVACPWSRLSLRNVRNSEFQFQKIFGEAQFIAGGVLFIPGGSGKPGKSSKDNAYVMHVLMGTVKVEIHRTSFEMGEGGSFFIPRGNRYSLTNMSPDVEARIFFAQGRQIRKDEDMLAPDPELEPLKPLKTRNRSAKLPQVDEDDEARGSDEDAALEEQYHGREGEDQGEEMDDEEEEPEPAPPPKKAKKQSASRKARR